MTPMTFSLLVGPGETVLTRTPAPASSAAQLRVSDSKALLVVP